MSMATVLRCVVGLIAPLAAWPVESSLIGGFEFEVELESDSLTFNERGSFLMEEVSPCSLSSSLRYFSSDERRDL